MFDKTPHTELKRFTNANPTKKIVRSVRVKSSCFNSGTRTVTLATSAVIMIIHETGKMILFFRLSEHALGHL